MGNVNKGRAVSQARCNISRECSNNKCVFKMLQMGYKLNPVSDFDKRRNAEIERGVSGKGYFPQWEVIGKNELVDLVCPDFREKR